MLRSLLFAALLAAPLAARGQAARDSAAHNSAAHNSLDAVVRRKYPDRAVIRVRLRGDSADVTIPLGPGRRLVEVWVRDRRTLGGWRYARGIEIIHANRKG